MINKQPIKISPIVSKLTDQFQEQYYRHQRRVLATGMVLFIVLIVLSACLKSLLLRAAAISALLTSFINMAISIHKSIKSQVQFFFLLGINQRYAIKRFLFKQGINNNIKLIKFKKKNQ